VSRAWKYDKATRLWNPCEMQDDLAAAIYVDQGIQREKDKYFYGLDSRYDHNSEYVPGMWDGRGGFTGTKERK